MSFGIGIGDIALVTRVGFKLWLNISGAEKEREDLTADLMNWRDRLEIVKLRLSDAQLPPRNASLARSQLSEALANLKLLEEMNRKLVKGRVFRRAAWEVCGREQFDKYRSDLEKCVGMIDSLFLCGSTEMVSRTTQENHAISRENNVILRGLEMRLRPFNLTPISTQVRFIDALNRERLIPFEWCLTMEKFRALVQINFDGSAGSSFVKKGEYDLINEESGALIMAEEWNKTIKPGFLLSMAIVVRKQEREGTNDPSCPACKRQFTGHIRGGNYLGRINCGYCGRWCQISPDIRASEPTLFKVLSGIGSSNSSHGHSEDDELIHIQRFHVRVTEISHMPQFYSYYSDLEKIFDLEEALFDEARSLAGSARRSRVVELPDHE